VITAIIQSRLNSTRLPGKALRTVAGKSVLAHVVDRVREMRSVDRLIVATAMHGGGAIAAHCEGIFAPWFIGYRNREENVLGRFVACMESEQLLDSDLIVRVCGDSPLLDAMAADELITEAVECGADYTGYGIDGSAAVLKPTGLICEVVKAGALRRADYVLYATAPEREHVTQYIYQHPDRFSCRLMPMPEWYDGQSYAVDTEADLLRIEEELIHG